MNRGGWNFNRARGLCGACGKSAPETGRTCCRPCADDRTKRALARYHANHPEAGSYAKDGEFVSARDRKLARFGRCKCGLLLPCHSCGPTIVELAESRRGDE